MTFQQQFVDTLNNATISDSRVKFFDDFLKIATTALSRDEKTYSTFINSYDAAAQNTFLDLFAALGNALNDCIAQYLLIDKSLGLKFKVPKKPRYRDVLGEIFHELELNDRRDGQVFTPQHIADLMGETTLTESLVQNEIAKTGYVTIEERCCGSGALVFGALNALLDMKINPCQFARVRASDVDERCLRMAFIQFSLYGIPAVVEKRDALSDELFAEPLITPILKRKIS